MLEALPDDEWNSLKAAHLLNRAGFGVDADTLHECIRQGLENATRTLIDYDALKESFDKPSWLDADAANRPDRDRFRSLTGEQQKAILQEERLREGGRITDLRAWWLNRMRYTKRPLQEKLTLFWHGHFATSMQKVRSAYAMYAQNETLRKHASGNWEDLIAAVGRDPAMLIYLDNAQSRKEHPNENFARELMELFTLGEGHYSETDVKESARAFTGWSLNKDRFEFEFRQRMHDDGSKEFLGHRGNFAGDDIVKIIAKQPATAPFICGKLWEFFAYEDPEPALVDALAAVFKGGGYEFKPVLTAMFRSREFYSERATRTQIKSPAQWLVGSALALDAPLPDRDAMSAMLRMLGQELFAPPNVKGWDGGFAWITTSTLVERYNLANALLRGGPGTGRKAKDQPMRDDQMKQGPGAREQFAMRTMPAVVDPDKVLPASLRTTSDHVQAYLEGRLFQGPLRTKDSDAFHDYLREMPEPATWSGKHVRDILQVMMSTPQYQLC